MCLNYISDQWCECHNECDCNLFMDELIQCILSKSVIGDDLSHLSVM